jgi:hypothetical protein
MVLYVVYLAETGRLSLTYDVFLHVEKLQLEHLWFIDGFVINR